MKLSEFIHKINLVTTGVITNPADFCYVKEISKDINYEESISLIDLITIFNNAYQAYIEDFKKLPSLQFLGEKISYMHSFSQEGATIIYLIINKPNIEISNQKWCYLEIIKHSDGSIKCQTANDLKWNSKNKKEVIICPAIVEKYLSLVEKHIDFLSCYEELKNKFIFGNGTSILLSNISGELSTFLDKVTFILGNNYINSEDIFKVVFELGQPLQIVFQESNISSDNINKNELEHKSDVINYLLKELYISIKYLPQLFQDKNSNIVRKRKKAG